MDQQLEPQSRNLPSTEIASERGFSIEAIIAGWLNESAKSKKTRLAYDTNLANFRALARKSGKDLIYFDENGETHKDLDVEIADLAQIFISIPEHLSPATQAQRLATISSFYDYAIRRRHIRRIANPVTLIKRPDVEAYAGAQAIPPEILRERIAKIDSSTQQGKQDLAILLVLVSTGRRVSEVAKIRRKDVEQIGNQIKLHFEHNKNDKQIDDLLAPEISTIVENCLSANHKDAFWTMPSDTPLWIDCYHKSRYGQALGYHGVANICQRWLGTSKVHTTRGTFAILMETSGAKITDIQQRLQHDNAATTGIYLNKLKRHQNAYSGKIVELLGLKEK